MIARRPSREPTPSRPVLLFIGPDNWLVWRSSLR
jgi:hypothetical protein